MNEKPKDLARKAYEVPRMTVISLRPEEAVLGNCKTNSSAGPISPGCAGVGGGGTCRGLGS